MSSSDEGIPSTQEEESVLMWVWGEVTGSYINIFLTLAIVYLIYKIIFPQEEVFTPPPPQPDPLKPQDMTIDQLKKYDGVHADGEGYVCMAVLGTIFDVTKGKRFYGPGGPYAAFAGRDASRGLATFDVSVMTDQYDDLADLKPDEMQQVQDWHAQFSEKYTVVGKLIRPKEAANQTSEAGKAGEDGEAANQTSAGEQTNAGELSKEDTEDCTGDKEDDYAKSFVN